MSFAPDNHPELFPYLLIAVSANALFCYLMPFIAVSGRRIKTFSKDFMDQFNEEHQQAFGEKIKPGTFGFPDNGNGRYSRLLDYGDWFKFNSAQRVHYNFLETQPYILTLQVIAGLKQPLAALILSCGYFLGRILYTIGYLTGGPNLRIIGTFPNFAILCTLVGLSLYTCSEYMKAYQQSGLFQ